MLYYSALKSGFFDDSIHSALPDDAVEISRQTHAELMAGQANGLRIVADNEGRPILAEPPAPPPPTVDQLLESCKAQAKRLIAETDWAVLPDVPLANKPAFETYRATLRGLIMTPVTEPAWPAPPEPEWS